MTIRNRWAIAATVLVMAMFAASCSDVSSTTGGSTGTGTSGAVPDNSGTTIKLAVNAWVGAEANAEVAANLLRDKLGYTVELVKIDEFEQFPALASGDLDATLEVWPSVHPKDYKQLHPGRRRRHRRGPAGRRRADRLVPADLHARPTTPSSRRGRG